MTKYLSHPKIAPDTVQERAYQTRMAEGCLSTDTLIVLPTGLGKTVVALIVAAETLRKGKKVLLVAPTKPLVDQHGITFGEWIIGSEVSVMNGNMDPERRAELVRKSDMVISTPQSVANDLEEGRYTLRDFGLIIYDEAHRGTGNYAYVTISEHNTSARSMGMTASPGSDKNKILEMCQKLYFNRIDVRADSDPDVRPYIYETLVTRVEVKLPKDLTDISDLLRKMLDEYGRELIRMGFMSPARPMSKKYLLQIQSDLQTRLRNNERTTYVYRGMVVQSICMKILHGMLLVETQGMTPFKAYIRSLKDEMFGDSPSKSTKELIKRDEFVKAVKLASESKVEHPKISRVMGLASQMLSEHPESKVMVFAQFRDMCDLLVKKLSALDNARVEKLIGQADGGLKQKEQIQLLDRFRKGEVNIVVSTSVGEEGLDVSSTDMVIFYEPVPDAIRMIQRRGRTGRKNDGEVFVMVALNTMDEAFESASAKKEERMREMLSSLNYELSRIKRNTASRGQMTLGDFS